MADSSDPNNEYSRKNHGEVALLMTIYKYSNRD